MVKDQYYADTQILLENVNILKYYEKEFKRDIKFLLNSDKNTWNRISMCSLRELDRQLPIFYGSVQNAFKKLKNKPYFLICYFYSVLLDQAIHSYSMELHCIFDNIAGYPKFVGMLQSYGSNFHPAILLCTSVLYTRNVDEFLNDFEVFTKYILNGYINFFNMEFPRHTSLLKNQKDINKALASIFDDIKISGSKEIIVSGGYVIWKGRVSKAMDILQNELKSISIYKPQRDEAKLILLK